MRRQLAALGAAALVLTGCTSGDDDATAPEPTATDSATPDATETASDEPTSAPSQEPRPASTPRLPEGFEPPSASGGTDADAEADAEGEGDADTGADGDTTSTGSSTQPLGSFATSNVAATSRSPFAPLTEPVTRSRNTDPTASCQVLAAAGETITACESGFVSSRGDQAFAVVVARDDADGSVSTRLFAQQGGSMVATTGAAVGANTLDATHWSRGDELVSLVIGSDLHVVGWDSGTAPQVVGSFDAGADVDLVAGRIVERSGGNIKVFAPSVQGSSGTQVASSAADPAPVDVALQVYDKWIAGDWSGMSGLATPTVVDALRAAHTTTDLFVFQGTNCTTDGQQAVCVFDSNGDRTTWRLERRDGTITVVDLK